MNDSLALERRYRRLLVAFPAAHRREYGEEMIGVLLASTSEGRGRPRLADAFDVLAGGLRTRFRALGAGLAYARWSDALAVCTVALPLMLFAALAVSYSWGVLPSLHFYDVSDFYPPFLAIALPPLIALRYRRAAALVALAAAAWFWFALLGQVTVWIDGLYASYCVELLVEVIALAGSPGPRRAAAVMTWKTWLVLSAAGITMGLASIHYPWALPSWQAAAVVFAFLAALGAGLVVTLPRPVALRLLLLLAVPAVPGAVWVLQFAGAIRYGPFPVVTFLPMLLLACLAVAAAWRARRSGRTA